MCFGPSVAKMLIDVSELRAWQALELLWQHNSDFKFKFKILTLRTNGLLVGSARPQNAGDPGASRRI